MRVTEVYNLTIADLSFERENACLFSHLHAELRSGEILQVRGANGSGKSTLLRLLATYLEPSSGKIFWQNHCINKHRDLYQPHLQYLSHQNSIKPSLTVFENLQLAAALNRNTLSLLKAHTLLEAINLQQVIHTQTQYLSAGQRRRVALTRLLLNPATLWILDEPLTALDSAGQDWVMQIVQQHCNRGGMAIIATHHHLSLTAAMKTIDLDLCDA
jgi:heme exporter protein A